MIYDSSVKAVYEAVKRGEICEFDFNDWVKDLKDAAHDAGWDEGNVGCSCEWAYDDGYSDGYEQGLADGYEQGLADA